MKTDKEIRSWLIEVGDRMKAPSGLKERIQIQLEGLPRHFPDATGNKKTRKQIRIQRGWVLAGIVPVIFVLAGLLPSTPSGSGMLTTLLDQIPEFRFTLPSLNPGFNPDWKWMCVIPVMVLLFWADKKIRGTESYKP